MEFGTMQAETLTLEEFKLRARRAGLELDAREIDMLFEEIATSCALMSEMAERVKTRLSPASEPAHIFRPRGAPVDEQR
jgi:hypothetical protein